ncbi:MAG TPA: DinB family protein [Chloroflexota bacterium]|nr:DinB family protein [Chloroflexota bacterium]
MASADVFIEAFGRVQQTLHRGLADITPEQLTYRPHPEANPIGWLAWHLTRWQDTRVSALAAHEQTWIAEGWHERFGRPADAADNGMRHTSEQVAALQATRELLLAYHDAVLARTLAYLRDATDDDLAQERPDAALYRSSTPRAQLIGVLSDSLQHAGQIAYLRGLLAGRHWGAG